MKMTNKDILRLSEIKFYFLDPPYTFKIHSYAVPQVDEIFTILEKYMRVPVTIMDSLLALKASFLEACDSAEATRKVLKQIAEVLSYLNRTR
jgi:hypothetical protein